MMDELRSVAKEDGGLAGLYRGIEPAVIGTVTSQTVYNYVYASLRVATARMREKKKRRRGPRARWSRSRSPPSRARSTSC